MIRLNRAASNVFDVTLTEAVTLENPYYLFVFENKDTKEISKIILSDTSVYPDRYNRFTLTEPTDLELIKGDYTYKVYETATSSLIIPDSDPLEAGICRVTGDDLSSTEYESVITSKVYESTE